MIVGEDGYVSGSIHRVQLKDLYDQTDDEALKAHYRELLGESAEGKAIDEGDQPEAEGEAAEPAEDLSKLTKAELVERAKAQGVDDAESLVKADLVSLLGG